MIGVANHPFFQLIIGGGGRIWHEEKNVVFFSYVPSQSLIFHQRNKHEFPEVDL